MRGRLAPSPTGALHLGNARSFLVAWLSVRSRGGSLVLRIEDLDGPRVKPESARSVLDDLTWLGLDWDEGPNACGPFAPYVQTERIERYEVALASLRERGLVYPCICTRRDIESAQSAPHLEDEGTRYPGTCRDRFGSFEEARRVGGRTPAWRFRVPEQPIAALDALHGYCEHDVQSGVGDFVVHRERAAYQLAVVVDDSAMQIDEVVRGDDLLTSMHRQLWLHRALGMVPPTYRHLPLIVGPDGRRLAKRHGDTRVGAFREAGVPADVIVGYLASTFGWAERGERLLPRHLIARYEPRTIPKEATILEPATWRGWIVR